MSEPTVALLRRSLFSEAALAEGRAVLLRLPDEPKEETYRVRVAAVDRRHLRLLPVAGVAALPAVPPGTAACLVIATSEGEHCFRTITGAAGADGGGTGGMLLLLTQELRSLQRRRHQRESVHVSVAAARLPRPGEIGTGLRFVHGTTVDLSEGGFMAHLPRLGASAGDLIAVSIALPGVRRRARATCRVLRSEVQGRCAAAFADIDQRSLADVLAFVDRRPV